MKITTVLILACIFHTSVITAQQTYQGTMVSKLGGSQTGKITVNLNGTNDELIAISSSEGSTTKKGGKKTKQTETVSLKLNVALVSSIIINDTTYYFRDIKYDYSSKYHMNSCVRLVSGNLDCGIFQSGRSYGDDNLFVKLPNDEFSKLIDINFDYYKATQGWHIMAFSGCPPLKKKMSAKETGYQWDDHTSREDRIAMWKQWVKEYNDCKSN